MYSVNQSVKSIIYLVSYSVDQPVIQLIGFSFNKSFTLCIQLISQLNQLFI